MRAGPDVQTPGGGLASAETKSTNTQTLPAAPIGRNPGPNEFTRVQAKFAKRQRTLHRVRSLASVQVLRYVVNHRGESRHFPTWPAVVEHLAQIGGEK